MWGRELIRAKWVVVGRMLSPRYSHAVTEIDYDAGIQEDCRKGTITTTPSPGVATALRGNVWLLTVITMFAMFSCKEFFN